MMIVLSPAKRLDWEIAPGDMTAPAFTREAETLAGHARQLSLGDLRDLMDLSDDLARLNRDRFRAMKNPDPGDLRPAAWAFAGDTYQGLAMADMEPDAVAFAEERLRILSGLYGLLRPRDAIRPYRLEMGTRLKTRRGRTLYAFWGDRLAAALRDEGRTLGTDWLLNCASQEYFAAIDRPTLRLRVVTPRFYEDKPKGPQMVSFHAKRARGAMARFVCEHRITDPAHLSAFDSGGYRHAPDLSEPAAPAFLRPAA